MPGDVASPTQPFPTKPAPFEAQGVQIEDLVDFTPELREMAIKAVSDFKLGPLFTPPSLPEPGGTQGTIIRPSAAGGANWTGAAVDPESGWLYVPSYNSIFILGFYEPDPKEGATLRYTHGGRVPRPQMPDGLPLIKPPYSRMTAIDLNTGEHVWMQPLGNSDDIRNHKLLKDLNLPPLGGDRFSGPLLTRTLLIAAQSAGWGEGSSRLVARDRKTGEVVAEVGLPASALGTPMTYLLNNRQYIALTVSGPVPELIAFALPAEKKP
jgi:quinoprotein glucose dehydrogenase